IRDFHVTGVQRVLFRSAKEKIGTALEGEEAAELGLVTIAYENFDWDDELRVMIEERVSFSPDALTGMEANIRFAGPETMETKIRSEERRVGREGKWRRG